jgi:Zn-dependent peptidase ImmA (M78 family)/transcriptional regulator with XRE-family HTH domain
MPDVNPKVLEWARVTAGLSLADAATVVGLASPERLAALESGQHAPSRPQLLRMSKVYHRSLLTLYLEQPPPRGDRGHDFRTLPGESMGADAVLDALVRDLTARHALVRATLLDDEEQVDLRFIGSARMQGGVAALVQSIRDTLSLDIAAYRARPSQEEAFSYLREQAEAQGIFVLLVGDLGSHHTAISVEAFRGFAIADKVAPFVVINDQDASSAWSFTLLHEIAHLWLGTTGVSGTRTELAIEQFCNDVAGELLLPATEARDLRLPADMTTEAAINAISEFARQRRLSRPMVAYRLHRIGLIDRITWTKLDGRLRELWAQERVRRRERNRASGSGPSYYVVRRHRLGKALISFVSRSVEAGTLSPTKGARVLGVKPRSLHPLLSDARPRSLRA